MEDELAGAAELRRPGAGTAGPARRPRRLPVAAARFSRRAVPAAAAVAAAVLAPAGCGPDAGQETALLRGDAAFARGDYEEALAEYRLSLRSEAPGTEGALRTAHAYLALGRVDEARALYDQAVRDDSAHAEQAVADFVRRARAAFANGDSYGGVSAMEAAIRFRPGTVVDDLVMPMARHYANVGEHGRALPLYLRVLEDGRDDPDLLFDAALAHREIGDCRGALGLLGELVELEPARAAETRWHVGSCAFEIAEELIREGAAADAELYAASDSAAADPEGGNADGGAAPDPEAGGEEPAGGADPSGADGAEAAADSAAAAADSAQAPVYGVLDVLRYLDMALDAGEPRTLLPEAYFRKAEILARMGRCAQAADAYERVLEVDAAGSGALVRLAGERSDAIRFADEDGRC